MSVQLPATSRHMCHACMHEYVHTRTHSQTNHTHICTQVEDLLNEPAQRASKMAANFKQQALRYHPDIHFPGADTHAPFPGEGVFASPPKAGPPEGGGSWVTSHATATPLYPVHPRNAAHMQMSPSKAPYGGSSSSHASPYGGHVGGGYQDHRSPPKRHVGGGEGGGGYNVSPPRGGYGAGGAGGARNGDALALDELRRSWGDKRGGGGGQNYSPARGGFGGGWAGGGRNEALPLNDLPMLR